MTEEKVQKMETAPLQLLVLELILGILDQREKKIPLSNIQNISINEYYDMMTPEERQKFLQRTHNNLTSELICQLG